MVTRQLFSRPRCYRCCFIDLLKQQNKHNEIDVIIRVEFDGNKEIYPPLLVQTVRDWRLCKLNVLYTPAKWKTSLYWQM